MTPLCWCKRLPLNIGGPLLLYTYPYHTYVPAISTYHMFALNSKSLFIFCCLNQSYRRKINAARFQFVTINYKKKAGHDERRMVYNATARNSARDTTRGHYWKLKAFLMGSLVFLEGGGGVEARVENQRVKFRRGWPVLWPNSPKFQFSLFLWKQLKKQERLRNRLRNQRPPHVLRASWLHRRQLSRFTLNAKSNHDSMATMTKLQRWYCTPASHTGDSPGFRVAAERCP